MRLLIVYIIVGASLYFVLSEMLKFTKAVSGGRRQRLKDLQRFKERLSDFSPVEWSSDELDLLSQKIDFNETSRIFNALYEGTFYTIYNEEIAHFIGKRFGKGFILSIRTAELLYVLDINDRGKGTLTVGYEEPMSCSLQDGMLKVIGQDNEITLANDGQKDILSFEDRILVEMNSEESEKVSSRAIQHLSKNVNFNIGKAVPFLLLFSLIWQEFITLSEHKA